MMYEKVSNMKKAPYVQPKVTVATFMVESGFEGSVILGAVTLQAAQPKQDFTGAVFTEYTNTFGEFTPGIWDGGVDAGGQGQ